MGEINSHNEQPYQLKDSEIWWVRVWTRQLSRIGLVTCRRSIFVRDDGIVRDGVRRI